MHSKAKLTEGVGKWAAGLAEEDDDGSWQLAAGVGWTVIHLRTADLAVCVVASLKSSLHIYSIAGRHISQALCAGRVDTSHTGQGGYCRLVWGPPIAVHYRQTIISGPPLGPTWEGTL
jgi:hypothetical protein